MADLGILTVKVQPDLGDFSSQVSGAMSNIGSGLARVAVGIGQDLASIGSRLALGAGLVAGAAAVIGIKTAAGLETATLQFQTLLGSADEATAKVQELFQFAKATPFESGPIIEASRRLQVFGGDALNTAENMQLVGDAAAATAAPIEEVAFWVGRAYSQIKGGQPFGEAAMRLQELGVLTPEVRTEMERLSEAGASSEEVFAALQGQLGQFTGAMELQANTLTGLTSTIKDQFSIGMAEAFKPAFEVLKDFLSVVRDFGDSDAFTALTDSITSLLNVLRLQLAPYLERFRTFMADLTPADSIRGVAQASDFLMRLASAAKEAYDTLGPLVPIVAGIGAALSSSFLQAIPLVGQLFPQFSLLTGALLGFTLGIDDNREALMDFLGVIGDAVSAALPPLRDAFKIIGDSLSGAFQDGLRNITPGIEYLVRDLVPALADVFAQVAPPLGDVVAELSELASGVILAIGPTLETIAAGVGSILSAGLGALADLLGLLNDNIAVTGPLLAGLALAFGAFKLVNFVQNIGFVSSALTGLRDLVTNVRMGIETTPNTSGWGRASGAIEGAALSMSGLGTALLGAGVTAGFAALAYSMQETARNAAEADDRVSNLVTTLERYGDTTRTAAEFTQDLIDNADYGAMLQLALDAGVGMDELTEAISGTEAEYQNFLDANKRDIAGEGGMSAVDAVTRAVSNARDEYSAARTEIDRKKDSQAGEEEQALKTASAQDVHTASIAALRYELDSLFSSQLNVAQSTTHYNEGMLRLGEALQAAGGDLQGFSAESLAAQSAVQGQAQSLMDLVNAQVASGTSATDAAANGRVLYDQLVATMTQYGLTDQEARDYLATLGLTPESIGTQADLAAEQAAQEATNYQNQLTDIDNTNPKSIVEVDSANAQYAIHQVDQQMNNLDGKKATVTIRYQREPGSGFMAQEELQRAGLQGVPMMGPDPMAASLLRADTLTATALRPRVYTPSLFDGLTSGDSAVVVPVIENRTYLGQTEVTDVVKSETVVIERDRSMKYLTGVG